MEYRKFGSLLFDVSAVGLGTWVTGGLAWGGSDDHQAAAAVEQAIASGITLIDTAPVYGFGRSEEIVGSVIKKLNNRNHVILATKCGLEWDDKKQLIRRNSSRRQILKEIDESRKRLQTDVIDIYQIHWPDEGIPFSETMETLLKLHLNGTIRAIGLSNFSVSQLQQCLDVGPVHSMQNPYNLFEKGIERNLLPFCSERNICVLTYGAICRGLLSGKFSADSEIKSGDIRYGDPKFKKGNLKYYTSATQKLNSFAAERDATCAQMAIQWTAKQPGVTCALVGARNPKQAEENAAAFDASFSKDELKQAESIVDQEILEPIGPEFMAPPKTGYKRLN